MRTMCAMDQDVFPPEQVHQDQEASVDHPFDPQRAALIPTIGDAQPMTADPTPVPHVIAGAIHGQLERVRSHLDSDTRID